MTLEELFKIWDRFEASSVDRVLFENESGKIELEKAKDVVNLVQGNMQMPVGTDTKYTQPVGTALVDNSTDSEKVNTDQPSDETVIKAPFVGTFYRSPGPDASPYVQVGQKVKKGDVLCIIEAMKIMNEITSPVDGVVRAIYANDDTLLEFNQAIMIIGEADV